MDELPEWLEREYGGLPVWQWAAIIAAGIGVALYVRRSFTPGDDDGPTTIVDGSQGGFVGLQPTGPTGGDVYSPNGSAFPGDGGAGADNDTDDEFEATAPETNGKWLEAAFAALVPSYSAALVDTALRRYLTGRHLSTEQFGVVDAALAAIGPPPEGAPAITLEPVPSDPGPTAPSDPTPRAPAPRAPAPEPEPPDDLEPAPGFDYVRDNLGALFVVRWGSLNRRPVHERDRDEARAIFGSPLSRSSQIPSAARNRQRAFLDRLVAEGRIENPNFALIYLDTRMGWTEPGPWTGTEGTR